MALHSSMACVSRPPGPQPLSLHPGMPLETSGFCNLGSSGFRTSNIGCAVAPYLGESGWKKERSTFQLDLLSS